MPGSSVAGHYSTSGKTGTTRPAEQRGTSRPAEGRGTPATRPAGPPSADRVGREERAAVSRSGDGPQGLGCGLDTCPAPPSRGTTRPAGLRCNPVTRPAVRARARPTGRRARPPGRRAPPPRRRDRPEGGGDRRPATRVLGVAPVRDHRPRRRDPGRLTTRRRGSAWGRPVRCRAAPRRLRCPCGPDLRRWHPAADP